MYNLFIHLYYFFIVTLGIQRIYLTITIGTLKKSIRLGFFILPLLFILGILILIKNRKLKNEILKNKSLRIILLPIISDIIFTITSTYTKLSLIAIISRMLLYTAFFISVIFWHLVKISKDKNKIIIKFLKALVVSILLNFISGIHQLLTCFLVTKSCKFWHFMDKLISIRSLPVGHQIFKMGHFRFFRIYGLFDDVNLLGMFLIFCLMLFISVFAVTKSKKSLIVISVLIVSYILTFSRSAIIGFVTIFPIVYKFIIHQQIKSKIKNYIRKYKIPLLIVAFISLIITIHITPLIYQKFTLKDSSTRGHYILFKQGLKLAKLKHYQGWGFYTFATVYQKYINPNFVGANPHSIYIRLLVEQGFLGFLLYCIFFVYTYLHAIHYAINANKFIRKNKDSLYYAVTTVINFAIPYFAFSMITYYGLFLPIFWGWGGIINF